MIGEETGRKVTPVEAAKQMCSQRDEASKLNFGKGGQLTVQQVMSYFSRPAVMKKLGQLPAAVESIEEDDIETLVQQSERYDLQKRIYNQLTLSILFQMPSEAREITLRLHQQVQDSGYWARLTQFTGNQVSKAVQEQKTVV